MYVPVYMAFKLKEKIKASSGSQCASMKCHFCTIFQKSWGGRLLGERRRSKQLRHQEEPGLDGRRPGVEAASEWQGGPGAGRLLTALGALDWVGEAGAQAWAVWHGDPPPGTRAVTRGVLVVVLRLQGREE
jgi:hypothetical protein